MALSIKYRTLTNPARLDKSPSSAIFDQAKLRLSCQLIENWKKKVKTI